MIKGNELVRTEKPIIVTTYDPQHNIHLKEFMKIR
jgi:hypothetical protein